MLSDKLTAACDERLLSIDLRLIMIACSTVASLPAVAFAVFELAWQGSITFRVCVFHRGLMLITCVYFCSQFLISFYGLQTRGPASAVKISLVLLMLLHIWEFSVLATLYCGFWQEPPVLLLAVRLARGLVLLAASDTDNLWVAWILFHGACDTYLFFEVALPESRVLFATLSTVVFTAETAAMGEDMQFILLPRVSQCKVVAVAPPDDNAPAAVIDRFNGTTKRSTVRQRKV